MKPMITPTSGPGFNSCQLPGSGIVLPVASGTEATRWLYFDAARLEGLIGASLAVPLRVRVPSRSWKSLCDEASCYRRQAVKYLKEINDRLEAGGFSDDEGQRFVEQERFHRSILELMKLLELMKAEREGREGVAVLFWRNFHISPGPFLGNATWIIDPRSEVPPLLNWLNPVNRQRLTRILEIADDVWKSRFAVDVFRLRRVRDGNFPQELRIDERLSPAVARRWTEGFFSQETADDLTKHVLSFQNARDPETVYSPTEGRYYAERLNNQITAIDLLVRLGLSGKQKPSLLRKAQVARDILLMMSMENMSSLFPDFWNGLPINVRADIPSWVNMIFGILRPEGDQ